MVISEENIAVCQKALFLLRQDFGLPTVETAAADTSLEWAKCRAAFDNAVSEVWHSHDWNSELRLEGVDLEEAPADSSKWTNPMRTALSYCLARELSIPLAGRMSDMKTWDGLFRENLMSARVISLEAERSALTDPVHREVSAILLPTFQPSPDLPRSLRSCTDRMDECMESSRIRVLGDHAWNFARERLVACSCELPHDVAPYCFAAELPEDCVHLEAVIGECGGQNDWKIFERTIVSTRPIRTIVYTRDVADVADWPALQRRCLILRLAADVSQTVAPDKMQLMEQRYHECLADAKTRDSRESNTPRDAWGRNHYVDAMRGSFPNGRNPGGRGRKGLL